MTSTARHPVSSTVLTRSDAAFIGLHAISLIACALQFFLSRSYENVLSVLIVLLSATVTFVYLRQTKAINEVPLSSFAVLGLCVTTQWGALVGQSLTWSPMAENLRVPLLTFSYLAMFQMVAISAHFVSWRLAFFMAARKVVSENLLKPLGLFDVPVPPALWTIGIIGLSGIVVSGTGEGGVGDKIAGAAGVLAWAPFAIPALYVRLGAEYCNLRRQLAYLGLYVGAAVVVGAALNFRSVMFVGALTAILLHTLFLLIDDRPFETRSLKWAAGAILVCAVLFQPISDFAYAVQIAREFRGKLSPVEMVKETFYAMTNSIDIQRTRDKYATEAQTKVYDEYYFKSPILARFVETKFHDNSFFLTENARPLESRLIADDIVDRIWAILPYPVLKAIGKEKSKYVLQYSAGDYISYLRFGSELGSFRVGSALAQLVAVFGMFAPFAYFVLCIFIFIFWDSLSLVGSRGAAISVVGMLVIYRLFAYGIVSESVSTFVGLLLRNHLQNVILYLLLYYATRLVWKPYRERDPAAERPFHAFGTPRIA